MPNTVSKDENISPLHGGDIQAASKQFNVPLDDWVDLSTGINPAAYPLPKISDSAFKNLPYLQDDFCLAVKHYYQQERFVASAGSQNIIQALPAILNNDDCLGVLLPTLGYKEHEMEWMKHGNALAYYNACSSRAAAQDIEAQLKHNPAQHLVIIQPNNPTAATFTQNELLAWSTLQSSNAFLIVDEAFIDIKPNDSLLTLKELPDNIIVLRSFGKFFGLAGIRLGFAFANNEVLDRLNAMLGLWQINGPAQYIAQQALCNSTWQNNARTDIQENAEFTQVLFKPLIDKFSLTKIADGGLFFTCSMTKEMAIKVFKALAQQGVLTRLIEVDESKGLIRVGLLNRSDDEAARKVQTAVNAICA